MGLIPRRRAQVPRPRQAQLGERERYQESSQTFSMLQQLYARGPERDVQQFAQCVS